MNDDPSFPLAPENEPREGGPTAEAKTDPAPALRLGARVRLVGRAGLMHPDYFALLARQGQEGVVEFYSPLAGQVLVSFGTPPNRANSFWLEPEHLEPLP